MSKASEQKARWDNLETSLMPPAGSAPPAKLEELTPEFLTACLRHSGVLAEDARVVAIDSARIGQGRGFAGQLARLRLRYEPESAGPATLIGKFASEHAPTRAMMSLVEGYEREVTFYRELAADVGISTPRCYFAHYDRAARRFCLLLEDLAPARSVDLEQGMSFEQAQLVLEQLAVMHARWWGRVGDVEWLQLPRDLLFKVRDRFLEALPGFLSQHADALPTLARVARRVAPLLADDELVGQTLAEPLTLAHNDMHVENVFLPAAEGGRFALIDWQSLSAARHGTGDVTRILCVGLQPALRRKHAGALLEHYHARLSELGVEGFSLSQLRRRYREEMTSMVMIAVIAFDTLDFAVEGGERTGQVLAERMESALHDAHAPFFLSLMALLWQVQRFFRRLSGGRPKLGAGG